MAINEQKLNEFMGKAVGDIGAGMSAILVLIGDKLGLYKALAGSPMTPPELAIKTETNERYIREWLNNQAASGYIAYDAKTKKYSLPPEQTMALADETSPVFIPGAFQVIAAAFKAEPRISKNFRTGEGLAWGEQDTLLFEGTERFFRPGYQANLVSSWIPSLEGVESKLKKGAKVADVGCGHGASTILMAQAYPNSKFHGFDYHSASIDAAKRKAKIAGVSERVTFEVAKSTEYPGKDFDLVAYFDCLHDMGDPKGASKHVRESLKKDGTFMLVEPFAGDHPEENHNPIGRIFYAASTMICVPASLAFQGPALGAQAGERTLKEVVVDGGGFKTFRRATQTPFNLIFEARP